jgi:hypothetical protein
VHRIPGNKFVPGYYTSLTELIRLMQVVSTVTGYTLENPGFEFRNGKEILLLSTTSRPALRPTQTRIPLAPATLPTRIKRAGREANQSSLSNVKVKNEWNNNTTPPIFLHGLERGLFYTLKVQLCLRQLLFCPT